MRVGEAVAELGITAPEGQELVFARFGANGGARHYTLAELADAEVAEQRDLYLATGTFAAGTAALNRRDAARLRAIAFLPFDCDLPDWIGLPKAEVHALADEALEAHLGDHRADIERVFGDLDLPIHRLDVSGYGHVAYVRVAPELQGEVRLLQALHKRLVRAINARFGGKLVDPQASDAGTRVTRLPGTLNTKGAIPRRARTIYQKSGALGDAQARALSRSLAPEPTPLREEPTPLRPNPAPAGGQALAPADAAAIEAVLAGQWTEGGRHALALGLAGMLAKAGIKESDAEALIERLIADDEQAGDRRTALANTYQKHAAGIDVAGYTKLKEAAPGAADTVDALLARYRQAAGPRLRRAEVPAQAPEVAAQRREVPAQGDERIELGFAPPPASVYFGWFEAYRALMAPTTEAPDQYHLAAALTLAGALIGRRVGVAWFSETLYPNLYTVLVGRTGTTRKDTAIKRALALPAKAAEADVGRSLIAACPFVVARDVSSAEGLIGLLQAAPNTLLYLSELTTMQANARRKGTRTIIDRLIEAWDTPETLQNLTKTNPVVAERPYLSILAATQPGRLADNTEEEDITSGFANRWLYVTGVGKGTLSRAPEVEWSDGARLYRELLAAIRSYPEGARLPLSEAALRVWDEWYPATLGESGWEEAEVDMRARHPNLAIKAALIYAVSERAREIEARHLEPAIALIDWSWGQVRELMRFWGVGIHAQIEQRIHNQIRTHGPMKRRDLQMKTRNRKWTSRDFATVFEAMVRNETIVADANGFYGYPEGA